MHVDDSVTFIVKQYKYGYIIVLKLNNIGIASCKINNLKTLHDFRVLVQYRRLGYGTELMDFVMSENFAPKRLCAKPYGKDVGITDSRLIQFYQKYGFKPTVTRTTGTWMINYH